MIFNQVIKRNSSGDVTIEPLNVVENGTYVAPDGTAYTPVTVNVSGGSVSNDDVRFIDYDGTELYTYSASDFMTLSSMPENPSHPGLIAQGWNWTLVDAQTFVEQYGFLDIGQMYATESGATEIDVEIEEESLSLFTAFGLNGTVTIDWGDGSELLTVTGNSTSTTKSQSHTYERVGSYTIKILLTSGNEYSILGRSNTPTGSYLAGLDALGPRRFTRVIRNVRIGSNALINTYAFNSCYMLKTVTIPNGIKTIGQYAFADCYELESITIPISTTSISQYAFNNCYNLGYISMPDSAISTGSNMLGYCYSLQRFSAKRLTNPGSNLLQYCVSLKKAVFLKTGQNPSASFSNCSNLEEVYLHEDATTIGGNFFSNCRYLKHINIPNKVALIDEYAFDACFSLESITLPERLTKIGNYAFRSCSYLKSVKVPDSVTSIGSGAFYSCSNITDIEMPSSITTFPAYLFYGCSKLNNLLIRGEITSFGNYVFCGCTKLKSITIPPGLTSIPTYMAQNCRSLKEITIPENVTSIGTYALAGLRIFSLTVPSSVTNISSYAFYENRSIREYHFLSTTPPTLGAANVFSYIPSDCVIYVPSDSVDAYKTATYWKNQSTRIVGE